MTEGSRENLLTCPFCGKQRRVVCDHCSPDTSDAVEVVAAALAFPRIFSEQSGPVQDYWRGKARAAISSLATIRAGVVEEAARVAEAMRDSPNYASPTDWDYGAQDACVAIAAAIRRLADGEKSGG